MLQKVTIFTVIDTNIAVLKDSREKVVYLSCNVEYVSNTATTVKE